MTISCGKKKTKCPFVISISANGQTTAPVVRYLHETTIIIITAKLTECSKSIIYFYLITKII